MRQREVKKTGPLFFPEENPDKSLETHGTAIHFVEIFHFVEVHSTHRLYLQVISLNFLIKVWHLYQGFSRNVFLPLCLKFETYAGQQFETRNICQTTDTTAVGNLH